VRIYKTKVFKRFQRKERVSDAALREAIDRAGSGLIDAALGRSLIKQRVARDGGGKRGGLRTVIAYRKGMRAIFMFGFAKSGRDNISTADERDLAMTGTLLLGLNEQGIATLMANDELWEVACNDEKAK
jgi:hypothetical protein